MAMIGADNSGPVMSFDPYHKWLGIPPDEQPPNHYRLLGINLFESDDDVVSNAADQRMAHVRSFQAGKRAEYSQRILNEVASARVCLLDPQKKTEYDTGLRKRLAPASAAAQPIPTAVPLRPAVSPSAVPASSPPLPPPTLPNHGVPQGLTPSTPLDLAAGGQPANVVSSWPRTSRKYLPLAIVVAVGAFAVILALAYLAATGSFGRQQVVQEPSQVPPAAVVPHPSHPPENGGRPANDKPPGERDSGSSTTPGSADGDDVSPPSSGSATPTVGHLQGQVKAPATGDRQDATDPGVADGGGHVVPGERTTVTKLPPPDNDSVVSARQRLEATASEESPQRLIARANDQASNDADTFAILSMAKDRAAASGDVQTALAAIDELNGRFEVDAFDTRMKLLTQLVANGNAETDRRALAELALTLVDEAENRGRNELAKDLAGSALAAARKSGDSELVRKVTLTIVRLQQH